MFIGHFPAGYILTKKLQKKFQVTGFLWLGLLGSVLPDFDIFYFYLVDHRQNLHHSYWIHRPFFWLILFIITYIVCLHNKTYKFLTLIFFSNIFLHLFLDTIVGKIEWLYPLSQRSFSFFDVPAVYNFWVYNFIFHWTFVFEIVVIIWAIKILFFYNKRNPLENK